MSNSWTFRKKRIKIGIDMIKIRLKDEQSKPMMEKNTIKVANYQALELIHESERTLVYRGINLENGQSVVVKLMGNEYPSFNELVQFRNQYAIAKNLEIKGIVKPYSLLR
ncbi:MAG: hypothetical protein F6K48_28575, partial [Okeania sp. SIO3H1]|nr:hypothetical protein [Okeania sp. SIO3H1]